MKPRTLLLYTTLLFSLMVSACGTGTKSTPDAMMSLDTATPDAMMMHDTATPDAMMSHDTATPDAMMMHDTATPDAMMSLDTATPDAMMMHDTATPGAPSMEMADWLGTSLVDVRTGQAFKVSDSTGKVVLVETMAVWCTTCHAQQQQIQSLHGKLANNPDFVSVSFDIDPNETPDILKKYVESNNGFNWMYAIAPADLARTIGQTYGDQFLNPPSAPVLIIDRHGIAHPLPFGLKNAEDLMKAIQPYLDDHM
jgi:cytochrome oxidase Cu insertion factor (SCO1/SenC/PrrC family)